MYFYLTKYPKSCMMNLRKNSSLDGVVPHLCYGGQILTSLAFLLLLHTILLYIEISQQEVINLMNSYMEKLSEQDFKKENVNLYRYMDLSKFVSMLLSSSLYFTRADKFSDLFEGSFPRKTVTRNNNDLKNALLHIDENNLETHYQLASKSREIMKFYHYMSCWQMNDSECYAMWYMYCSSKNSVCVQTTESRFKASLPDNIAFNPVRYINYDDFDASIEKMSDPFFYKKQEFSFEKEFRAIVTNYDDMDVKKEFIEEKVDLNCLIEKIIVHPESDSWFLNVIDGLCKKFGLNVEIIPSSMKSKPTF